MANARIQPYQLLFPVGILYAVCGSLVWTLYAFGVLAGYPGAYHAHWMVGGFLLSFSAGFLLTAIPRFTGASDCRNAELAVAVFLACAQGLHPAFSSLLLAFLAIFVALRIRFREYSPPRHFIFVPLGLLLGFVGSVGMALIERGGTVLLSYSALRVLFFQGTILCFVVGVGARLVRILLGYEGSRLVQISKGSLDARAPSMPAEGWPEVGGVFFLILCGFVVEAWPGRESLGRLIRSAGVLWVALRSWHLYRLPPRRGALVWGLYLGCWSVAVGSLVYAFVPGWEIHSVHVLLVGGFATLALMVASRVMLAHGGYPLAQEDRSLWLRLASLFLILAMATRVLAPMTKAYLQHLGYAGATAGAAFLIWGGWMCLRIRHFRSLRA